MVNAVRGMLNAGVDALGDFNPQLLREIQGRLRWRNVLLTLGTSLIGQGIFWLMLFRSLNFSKGYCHLLDPKQPAQNCWQFGESYAYVDWHQWWFTTFGWGCWILLLFAVGAGSFLLISDLSKEQRRGTLTFLNLSPQSAQTILLGKMLGVPILVYLAIAVALPFHYYSGMMAKIPMMKILTYDILVLMACSFFYSAALLFGLVGQWLNGFQAWLGSAGFLGLLQLSSVQSLTSTSSDWFYAFFPSSLLAYLGNFPSKYSSPFFFYRKLKPLQYVTLPIGELGSFFAVLIGMNLLLWTFWIWQALERRYQNPNASLVSKQQSYLATLCFTICHLGFGVSYKWINQGTVFSITFLHLLWFLLLIVFLTPQRQPFLDWARNSNTASPQAWKSYLYHENSPIWVAILINLFIATIPVIIWAMLSGESEAYIDSLSLILTALLLLTITLFHQLLLFKSLPHRAWWMMLTLFGPVIIPTLLLAVSDLNPNDRGGELFLFTPISVLVKDSASIMAFGLACLAYMGVILLLILQLNRKLKRYGESETAKLLQEAT